MNNDKQIEKLRRQIRKLRKNIKSASKESLQMLIDAGICTKTGRLKKLYR